MNSIVACCHSATLYAHAVWAFRSQQNCAVTRIWRSRQVQPSQKERAIGAVCCEKGMLLQPLCWRCAECMVHHKRNVRKEQYHIYVAQASNNMSDLVRWTLLLLAATVWSFAHMPLRLSNRNNTKHLNCATMWITKTNERSLALSATQLINMTHN